MTSKTILKATNLSCRYNDKEVIAGLEISLQPGDVLGLLGANGVGKTTTLKILAIPLVEGFQQYRADRLVI